MLVRQLDSAYISKLVRISGIVTSVSTVMARPSTVHITCRSCGSSQRLSVDACFGGSGLPRTCQGADSQSRIARTACPLDPFVIVSDKSRCVDQQIIKLQEPPDAIDVGELPRHIILVVDRYMVNQISPGTRVTVSGVYSIFQSRSAKSVGVAIRCPYVRVLGIEKYSTLGGKTRYVFTDEQERDLVEFSKQPCLYETLARSIAPSIYGNEDIKKALVCLLFGGTRKHLPDQIKLRGDINVLLLGDPGTAKSQFLKFVERVSPISVYTSGKGSSAAGLTASVIRDPGSGEFYLEGGAMVLADGGVVCIDEFDKMRDEDRVAIHEAMEQQTISIAKAGITTMLNSRTSVLAAANPIFGRYDEMKSPGENVGFSSTILSRFDMIFIVKDDHNAQRDISLAHHVLAVHISNETGENTADHIGLERMRMYIAYCRERCAPRLGKSAAKKLSDHYVSLRSQVSSMELETEQRSPIPITVRQLEAVIRISESLAKMTLSNTVNEEHVDEALRLFRVSTMQAIQSGHVLENGLARPDVMKDVEKVERWIKDRYPIGSAVGYSQLMRDSASRGFSEQAVVRCIDMMAREEKIIFRNQRRVLVRQP